MDEIFNRLQKLYENFDRENFHDDDIICLRCGLCCSSRMKFFVSPLEYDFLEYFLKENPIEPDVTIFRAFMTERNREYCPYYDREKGCAIYTARPLCCRLFGNFHFKGDPPPRRSCVYYRKSKRVPLDISYENIKYIPDFIELKCKYELIRAENKDDKIKSFKKLSNLYAAQERLEEALFILKEGEKIFPEDAEIYYETGFIYKWMNNLDMARVNFEKSLELGSVEVFPSIYQNLGYVYSGLKLYDKAYEAFEKALKLDPSNSHSYLDMAFINLLMGNKEEALASCNRAFEIEPGKPVILKMKESIEGGNYV